MYGDSFVITISGTGREQPVHIVLPHADGVIVYEEIYVLAPIGVTLPERYTIIIEEALQALEIAAKFLIEGKAPDKFRGLGDWFPRPLDE
jgi:hypothetical protein